MPNKNDSNWFWLLAIGGGLWLLSKMNAPVTDVTNGATAAAAESLQADQNATIWDRDYSDPDQLDAIRAGANPDLITKPPQLVNTGGVRFLGPPIVVDDYKPDSVW